MLRRLMIFVAVAFVAIVAWVDYKDSKARNVSEPAPVVQNATPAFPELKPIPPPKNCTEVREVLESLDASVSTSTTVTELKDIEEQFFFLAKSAIEVHKCTLENLGISKILWGGLKTKFEKR